jgi:hypothetical protein
MMATTHAFVGAALASVTLLFAPAVAPLAMAAGFVGGVVPDLDVLFDHRRTLHFPVYGPFAAVLTVLLAALVPTTASIALAAFVLAAALHPVMDAFGGSKEARPWLHTTDHAVYDHYNRRWLAPRHWVRYDGSPGDFVVGAVASVPLLALATDPLWSVVVASLVVSLGYTVFRRQVVDLWERFVDALPDSISAALPLETPESVPADDGESER